MVIADHVPKDQRIRGTLTLGLLRIKAYSALYTAGVDHQPYNPALEL